MICTISFELAFRRNMGNNSPKPGQPLPEQDAVAYTIPESFFVEQEGPKATPDPCQEQDDDDGQEEQEEDDDGQEEQEDDDGQEEQEDDEAPVDAKKEQEVAPEAVPNKSQEEAANTAEESEPEDLGEDHDQDRDEEEEHQMVQADDEEPDAPKEAPKAIGESQVSRVAPVPAPAADKGPAPATGKAATPSVGIEIRDSLVGCLCGLGITVPVSIVVILCVAGLSILPMHLHKMDVARDEGVHVALSAVESSFVLASNALVETEPSLVLPWDLDRLQLQLDQQDAASPSLPLVLRLLKAVRVDADEETSRLAGRLLLVARWLDKMDPNQPLVLATGSRSAAPAWHRAGPTAWGIVTENNVALHGRIILTKGSADLWTLPPALRPSRTVSCLLPSQSTALTLYPTGSVQHSADATTTINLEGIAYARTEGSLAKMRNSRCAPAA